MVYLMTDHNSKYRAGKGRTNEWWTRKHMEKNGWEPTDILTGMCLEELRKPQNAFQVSW